MSTGSASGGVSARSSDVVSSIIIIIIVTVVTTTTLNYSGLLATGSSTTITTPSTASTNLTTSVTSSLSNDHFEHYPNQQAGPRLRLVPHGLTRRGASSPDYPIDMWVPSCVVSGVNVTA